MFRKLHIAYYCYYAFQFRTSASPTPKQGLPERFRGTVNV